MDILGSYTFLYGPKRVVHIARSLDHLYFLHQYRPVSHLLGLPTHCKWMEIEHCRKHVDIQRICATMGKPNPLWSMEIVYHTPIKRLLIEDRLIEFQSLKPTLEFVEVRYD
jgi:hypothetical protein